METWVVSNHRFIQRNSLTTMTVTAITQDAQAVMTTAPTAGTAQAAINAALVRIAAPARVAPAARTATAVTTASTVRTALIVPIAPKLHGLLWIEERKESDRRA
ncbi:hypothetical protein GMOD_00004696 [Pyrenophora seminiperda CCB06]|uniref:Uncharacterized protein n=1 Tax=Pyrenophora seminiperda CCB06 TaxID=1302712 RepID=A0A3M7MHU1_9PLEO|nr:hypothetical protein GMOD_00004696 [Pyrenophora seminiperda CCB06]